MKNWFTIKAQADQSAPAEISIHDAIGGWNVNAKDFLDQLKTVSAKEITLTMNSPGGSVIDGIAIYNGLRNHAQKTNAKITVKVLGIVASIASVIAMAGDKISMPKNTFMMVHNPSGGVYGTAEELRGIADWLDKFGASLIDTYVARTGKTPEEIKALLDGETLLTADEALALGFADEVTPALTITASFDPNNLPDAIRAVFDAAQTQAPPSEPVTAKTFAVEVVALAREYAMEAHAEAWLLDASIVTLDQVRAAIAEAAEVRDLCAFAQVPEMANQMIAARTSLTDARAQLCKLRADASDAANVDGTQPSTKQPPSPVPQAAISTADIYAARRANKEK